MHVKSLEKVIGAFKHVFDMFLQSVFNVCVCVFFPVFCSFQDVLLGPGSTVHCIPKTLIKTLADTWPKFRFKDLAKHLGYVQAGNRGPSKSLLQDFTLIFNIMLKVFRG